jgi:hypothetical protein
MSYVLATTERRLRWYQEMEPKADGDLGFALHDILDLDLVSSWSDKESAKLAAQRMGLATWRYVKL